MAARTPIRAPPGIMTSAIAYGANSYTTAVNGFGNFALADGPSAEVERDVDTGNFDSGTAFGESEVEVFNGNFDSGTVVGNGNYAEVGFGGNFDNGIAIGTDSDALPRIGQL